MSGVLPEGLPAKIRVGYFDYELIAWDRTASNAARRYGECSSLERCIRVDFGHGPLKDANTLLHEIMHAVCTLFDLEDGMKEEDFVTRSANGLCGVWRDNPEVMAWIAKGLTGSETVIQL